QLLLIFESLAYSLHQLWRLLVGAVGKVKGAPCDYRADSIRYCANSIPVHFARAPFFSALFVGPINSRIVSQALPSSFCLSSFNSVMCNTKRICVNTPTISSGSHASGRRVP